MPASDYLAGKLLDHMKGTAYTYPSTIYVAFYTSNPGPANTGTECSGNNYARTSVAASAWTRTANELSNTNAITSPVPSGAAWGTVSHFAIFDAASGGNLLEYAPLDAARLTSSGNALNFPAGSLKRRIATT